MGMKELRDEISEEVSTILASDFQVEVVETDTVLHSGRGRSRSRTSTGKRQGTKLIDTCVLYIDIRRLDDAAQFHAQAQDRRQALLRLRQGHDPLRPPQRRARTRDHR